MEGAPGNGINPNFASGAVATGGVSSNVPSSTLAFPSAAVSTAAVTPIEVVDLTCDSPVEIPNEVAGGTASGPQNLWVYNPYLLLSSSSPSSSLSTIMQFPPPHLFYSADPYFDHQGVFALAPWLDPLAYRDDHLMSTYTTADYLPGDIHIDALTTRDWHYHCALPDSYLHQRQSETQFEMRRRFAKLVYQRTRRWLGRAVIPRHLDTDIWIYRTEGEIPYVTRLMALSMPYSWQTGAATVEQAALVLGVQIPQQFRYAQRNNKYWSMIRWEREARSRTGFLVSYHNVEIDAIRINKRDRLYVPVPIQWQQIEAPEGLRVEMSPCLAYAGCQIMRNLRTSSMWRVLYTEYIAKMAGAWLWEMYDTYRMFHLPTRAVFLMRMLDLSPVLGSTANAEELRALLDVMQSVDWDNPSVVPLGQNARTRIEPNYAPGRRHSTCGDWVWYNPWERTFITEDDAAYFRANPFEAPEDQPDGYFYWDGTSNVIPTTTVWESAENSLAREAHGGPSF